MADQKLSTIFVKYRYFLPAAVLGLISLIFIGVGGVYANKFLELRSELKSEEETLEEVMSTLRTLENLSLEGLDTEQLIVETALPAEKPIFEVLTNLSRIASSSGIALRQLSSKPGSLATESAVTGRSVSTSPSKGKEKPDNFKLTVSLEGPYQNMRTFFDLVNNTVPLIALDEVRITSRDESSFSSEVDFLVYWKPREKVVVNSNTNVQYQPFSQEQESVLAEIVRLQQILDASISSQLN